MTTTTLNDDYTRRGRGRSLIAGVAALAVVAPWIAGGAAAGREDRKKRRAIEKLGGKLKLTLEVMPDSLAALEVRNADKATEESRECLEHVAALGKAGVTASDRVPVPHGSVQLKGYKDRQILGPRGENYGWEGTAPLGEVRRFCAAMHELARVAVIRFVLEWRTSNAQERLGELEATVAAGKKVDDADWALFYIEESGCNEGIADARKRGLAEDVPFVVRKSESKLDADIEVTLATAKAKVCDRIGAMVAKAKEAHAAFAERELAPFVKAFGGKNTGRYKAYVDKKLAHIVVHGPGRKRLSTPRDYARAKRWYILVDRTGTPQRPVWHVERISFRGRRYQVKRLSGRGKNPPRRIYR